MQRKGFMSFRTTSTMNHDRHTAPTRQTTSKILGGTALTFAMLLGFVNPSWALQVSPSALTFSATSGAQIHHRKPSFSQVTEKERERGRQPITPLGSQSHLHRVPSPQRQTPFRSERPQPASPLDPIRQMSRSPREVRTDVSEKQSSQ